MNPHVTSSVQILVTGPGRGPERKSGVSETSGEGLASFQIKLAWFSEIQQKPVSCMYQRGPGIEKKVILRISNSLLLRLCSGDAQPRLRVKQRLLRVEALTGAGKKKNLMSDYWGI